MITVRHNISLFLVIACMVISQHASAQRTVAGRGAPMLSAVYTGSSYGVHAGWTGWTLWGNWNAGAFGRMYSNPVDETYRLEHSHVGVESEAMFRVLSTRSRMFSLYLGGGAFIGAELVDPRGVLPDWMSLQTERNRFLYGIHGAAEMDLYILKRLSVGIRGTVPISFSSSFGWLNWETGLVLRFDI